MVLYWLRSDEERNVGYTGIASRVMVAWSGMSISEPEKDFRMCIDRNRFDFVLRIEKDAAGLKSVMVE